jgi:hypothetical protein
MNRSVVNGKVGRYRGPILLGGLGQSMMSGRLELIRYERETGLGFGSFLLFDLEVDLMEAS